MSVEVAPVMINIGAASAANPAANLPASTIDVAQFQQAYAEAQRSSGIGTENMQVSPGADSEGFKALLGTLNSLNGQASGLGDLSKTATGSADLTPGDMLMLSVRCHEFLFHCELTSNVANRTSDGVQQLFRQQS